MRIGGRSRGKALKGRADSGSGLSEQYRRDDYLRQVGTEVTQIKGQAYASRKMLGRQARQMRGGLGAHISQREPDVSA